MAGRARVRGSAGWRRVFALAGKGVVVRMRAVGSDFPARQLAAQLDSILNSLGDIASFVLGFYIARKLGLWRSVAIFVAMELLMLWLMRDNLTLNVLMLLWPIDAVRKWQAGT
jgi:hypothetical protein